LQEAQAHQTKYAGGKEVVHEVGDEVWIATWKFQMTSTWKKWDYNWTGPYVVSKVHNKNAYKLDLRYTIQKNIFFHVSPLDSSTPHSVSQPPSEQQPTIVYHCEQWAVDWILDSESPYWALHHLVQWAGHSYVRTSWKAVENFLTLEKLVKEYH